MNNNSDNKNTYVKTGFNTYNNAVINADVHTGASDMSCIRDADNIDDADNNTNS